MARACRGRARRSSWCDWRESSKFLANLISRGIMSRRVRAHEINIETSCGLLSRCRGIRIHRAHRGKLSSELRRNGGKWEIRVGHTAAFDKYRAKTWGLDPSRDRGGNRAVAARCHVNLVLLYEPGYYAAASRRHSARIMGCDIIRTVFRVRTMIHAERPCD